MARNNQKTTAPANAGSEENKGATGAAESTQASEAQAGTAGETTAQKGAEAKTTAPANATKKGNHTVAVVLKNHVEVRQFTLEIHGEEFEALANEFVATNGDGMNVELR